MWKYIKVVCKVIFPLFYAYFSWMIKYSRHPERYPLEVRFSKVQKLVQKVLKAFNANIDFEKLDEYYSDLNCKNRLIICNHISDSDPLVFIACAKRPLTFVAKIESKEFVFVGRVVKILSGEFIDRNDLKQNLKVMRNIQEKLESDENIDVVIFPEGTRNKVNIYKTLEYHHGTFRPAFKSNLPIDVFAITGNQGILSFKDKSKVYNVHIFDIVHFDKDDYVNKTTADIAKISQDLTNDRLEKYKEEIYKTIKES